MTPTFYRLEVEPPALMARPYYVTSPLVYEDRKRPRSVAFLALKK